ncbi:MAG: amino acid carrier protein [Bacilli bacterium]
MDIITKLLWIVATSMILFVGSYLTVQLKFVQFRFLKMFKCVFFNGGGVSPLPSLMLTLGGRIGVGSVAGVALALYLGGPGAIFWMIVISFIVSSITFGETVLGMKYHEAVDDSYSGGTPYYIKKGLKKPFLGICYACLVIVSYIGGFLGIQANTITKALNEVINISPLIVGFFVCFISVVIIFGGLKKITMVINKIVPFMLGIYLLFGIYVFVTQFALMPDICYKIVSSAFCFDSIMGGFISSFIVGIQRGIFSNEGGLGTGSLASSTSGCSLVVNGYVQMFGIYVTMFVCVATAIIIMSFDGGVFLANDVNGIEIIVKAFYFHMSWFGYIVIITCLILFCFSTVLTGYYYGESCCNFLFKRFKGKIILFLKIVTVVVLFCGCVVSSSKLWGVIDFLVGILCIINVYAIYALKDEIKRECVDYDKKKC